MTKTIFVLLDGCRYDTITELGFYLEELVDKNKCAKYKIKGELPSNSRPMYETLFTGLKTSVHGIIKNDQVELSKQDHVFKICREHNLVTAAAAYHWISELYNKAPYNHLTDRFQLDNKETINYGIFYTVDPYPDSHLYLDGDFLRKKYKPDFLFIHSMNIDGSGHIDPNGGEGQIYRQSVQNAVEELSKYINDWIDDGYQVVITADHGMNKYSDHGGDSIEETTIPCYIISNKFKPGRFDYFEVSQLEIAPLLCELLEISKSNNMVKCQSFIK